LVFVLAVAGCGGGGNSSPTVESSVPDFGPLSGGTRIVLTGSGFSLGGAAPNRVLIGGHEALLASAIDDGTLEVTVPPGEMPGAADIVVINHNGIGTSSSVFHYSAVPSVTSVTPGDVLDTSGSTKMTITGTGFKDEGAGFVQVLLDGTPAVDVQVMSDTEITFTALASPALSRPALSVVNGRGAGIKPRAFRFVPSTRGGLLLFPQQSSDAFFYFFDPVDQSVIAVPHVNPASTVNVRGVIVDPDGDYAAFLRDGTYGKIDFRTQTVPDPVQTNNQLPAVVNVSGTLLGVSRRGPGFGKFDPVKGTFTPIGSATMVCCGSFGIAADASGNTFVSTSAGISTIDKTTGIPGANHPFAPVLHIQDMRFLGTTLYGVVKNTTNAANSDLVTINANTGSSAVIKGFTGRITSLEVFQ
jgi:hypothetical protein